MAQLGMLGARSLPAAGGGRSGGTGPQAWLSWFTVRWAVHRAREITLRTGKERSVTGLGQTAALLSAGHFLEQMTSSAPLCAP